MGQIQACRWVSHLALTLTHMHIKNGRPKMCEVCLQVAILGQPRLEHRDGEVTMTESLDPGHLNNAGRPLLSHFPRAV